MAVQITTLPSAYYTVSARLWPLPPPPFPDGEPTAHDVEFARELVRALDPASRRWYAARFPDLT